MYLTVYPCETNKQTNAEFSTFVYYTLQIVCRNPTNLTYKKRGISIQTVRFHPEQQRNKIQKKCRYIRLENKIYARLYSDIIEYAKYSLIV